MFDTLRNNSRIIVYLVVIAFVISGGFMGYGAYLNNRGGGQAPNQGPAVIAEVNGMEISQQEYYSMLQQQAPNSSLSSSQIIPFRYQVLEALIERKLILAKAEEFDIQVEVSDSEVDENYNNILEQNEITDQELAETLAEQGSTIGELRENIKDSLQNTKTLTEAINQGVGEVEVSDQEIQKLYNQRYLKVETESKKAETENSKQKESDSEPKLEEVSSDLKTEIKNKKRNEAINNWLKELKTDAQITINQPVLKAYHDLENENYEQAVKQFSDFVEQENTDPIFYSYLAAAYQGQNNYDRAETAYENGLNDFPDNKDLRFKFAEFLAEQDKNEAAVKQLDEISANVESSSDFMTYYKLFIMYSRLGAEEKAEIAMEKAREISAQVEQNQQNSEIETDSTSPVDQDSETMEEDLEIETPLETENSN